MAYAPRSGTDFAPRPSRPPASWKTPRQSPLELLWKGLALRFAAKPKVDIDATLAPYRGDEQFEILDAVTKSAVIKSATTPATISNSEWLSAIVRTVNTQWIESLSPSVFGQLLARSMNFPTTGHLLQIPERSTTPKLSGGWVAEADEIPVGRMGLAAPTLLRTFKLGVLSEFTNELRKHSQPTIESVIRAVATEDASALLDATLLDDQPETTARPAGLLFGVTPNTPSAASTHFERVSADIRNLVQSIQPSGRIAFVANPVQLTGLQLGLPYASSAFTIVAAQSVPIGSVLAINLDGIAFASEAMPTFDFSSYANIHESDTPLPLVGGVATPPVIASVAAPVRSLWQTDCTGLRMIWPVGWVKRRASAVSVVESVAW